MDVAGKRVVVMGLGTFSGGVSAARFMARRGARVTVTDLAPPEKLAASVAALANMPIEAMHLGGHRAEDFRDAEIVVVSPAVREDDRFTKLAREAGAVVTTEMNLFFELCPAPIVGVTGSNGKSTTAAMLHAMLAETSARGGRPCWLGGNIGRSLLELVDEIRREDLVVLELSSFQLEDLDELGRSPHVAVVTTFTPNHLDRHPTLEAYRSAKQAILRHQHPGDLASLNADGADVRDWPTRSRTVFFGLDDHGRDGSFASGDEAVIRANGVEMRIPLFDVLRLPGRHNRSNALAAACCATALGARPDALRRAIAEFRTLPHRLELVGEMAGRRFYDDSIATTPESTLAALESFDVPLWLIAGGSDKGLDLGAIAERIAQRVRGVALLGQTAARLHEHLVEHSPPGGGPQLADCADMHEAVAWCFRQSQPGDSILLSPACASFGMFQNFAHRAEVFRQAMHDLSPDYRAAG